MLVYLIANNNNHRNDAVKKINKSNNMVETELETDIGVLNTMVF